jgi:hypothetical protein
VTSDEGRKKAKGKSKKVKGKKTAQPFTSLLGSKFPFGDWILEFGICGLGF